MEGHGVLISDDRFIAYGAWDSSAIASGR